MVSVGKQGHGDALCGIYSLANSLTEWTKSQGYGEGALTEAFRRVIMATDWLRLLDAYHIIEGFEDFELIKIFNQMALDHRLARVAVPLELVKEACKKSSGLEVVRDVIRGGGTVVVSVEKGGHWILAHKLDRDGVVSIIDPWPDSGREQVKRIDNVENGVALLPRDSELVKLTNVQMH